MHKSDVFFYLTIAFLGGIFLGSFIPDNNLSLWILLAGVLTIGFFGYEKNFSQKGLLIGFIILIAGAGMARYGSYAADHSILETFASKQVKNQGIQISLNGYVDQEQSISSNG